MQRKIVVQRIVVQKKPITISLLLALAMTSSFILSNVSPASSTVTVPQRTDGGTTLEVSVPVDRSVSGSSVDFDLSQSIRRPTSWDNSQTVAVEVALTTAGSDSATVFRGSGGCVVDLSSSASTATYSTTQGDGLVSITGVTNQIFVMNDQSPQLSLQGRLDDVLTALQKVQIRCNAQSDLVSKFVRVGAVPSKAQTDTNCTAQNSIYNCNGPLFYLFSTQRYYQLRYHNHSTSGDGQIQVLFDNAKAQSIDVDGSVRSGATARYGWVATLSEQDEIRLTNALNQPAVSMIGTTDRTATWTWDTSAWGSSSGNTGFANSGSNCATDEGDFRWIGPDVWCLRVPAKNQQSANRYWVRNSNQWVTQESSTNALIDFDSPTNSVNGFNLYHAWGSSGNITEPNASGDFVYQANSVATWDDTNAPGPWKNYFIEYCDPNKTCPPPNEAVASTQLKLTQTITFSGAAASYPDQTVNLTAATTTSGLTITYSSSNTSICTVNANAVVTLVSRGRCEITASQSGNTDYLAATAVTQSFDSFFGPIRVSSCPGSPAIYTDTGTGRFGLNGGFETPEGANALAVSTTRGYTYRDARSDGTSTRTSGGNPSRAAWTAQGLGITLAEATADVDFGLTASTISGVSPVSGTRYGEISGTYFGGIYQDITTVGGSQIRWRIYHRARTGTESIRVLIGTNSGTTSYSTATSTFTINGTFTNTSGEQALRNGTGSLTNDISGDSSAWNFWEGTYNVPSSQTTTRFMILPYSPGSGNISSSTGDAQGNLLDQISFMPTLACPDTSTFMEGFAGTSNIAFNDFPKQRSASGGAVETNLSVSTVGTWPNGFSLSGTSLSVASTVPVGTYSLDYRLTDGNNVQSISTVTVNIIAKSLPNLPSVILVDPRVDYVDFPQITFSGADNLNICVFESNSSGVYLGADNRNFFFDFVTKGSSETRGPDGAPDHIQNDRTNYVVIYSSRTRAENAFNSSGGLRVYLNSPHIFNSASSAGGSMRYIRVATQAVATATTNSQNCPQATSSTSQTIEVRRLGLTTTLKKGTIQLK